MGADDSCALVYAHALEVQMKVSRRGFLPGAAAAGLASGTGAAGALRPTSSIRHPRSNTETACRIGRSARPATNVSILGISGYHIGIPEEADGVLLIRTAIDAGVSFMDNAWEYKDGESERRMGRTLRDGYHQRQHGFSDP